MWCGGYGRVFQKMVVLDKCSCCRVLLATAFLAVYLLIGYLIAFAFELLWLLESPTLLPTPAILLCAGYFALALFSALLLHGLATKTIICLVAWMFAVTVLTFPEAGLVIYMSVQYWRIESVYGATELACWLARIVANVILLVLVHTVFSNWKDEDMVTKRLRDLSLTAVSVPRERRISTAVGVAPIAQDAYIDSALAPYFQQGVAFEVDQVDGMLKRSVSIPQLWPIPNNLSPYSLDGYQCSTTPSEFNASVFVPNFYNDISGTTMKKSQSLGDLRFADNDPFSVEGNDWQSSWVSTEDVPPPGADNPAPYPNYALSLDRKAALKLPKYASMDDLLNEKNASHIIRNRTGFYAQPIENFGVPIYYGPLDGPDFLIYRKQIDKLSSRNSLSNTSTDDVQKYRDVAL